MKQEVIALLGSQDDEVAWRIEAMRPQLRPGPIIPFLVARRDFVDAPGRCLSCGDPCGPGRVPLRAVRARRRDRREQAWKGRRRSSLVTQHDRPHPVQQPYYY